MTYEERVKQYEEKVERLRQRRWMELSGNAAILVAILGVTLANKGPWWMHVLAMGISLVVAWFSIKNTTPPDPPEESISPFLIRAQDRAKEKAKQSR